MAIIDKLSTEDTGIIYRLLLLFSENYLSIYLIGKVIAWDGSTLPF